MVKYFISNVDQLPFHLEVEIEFQANEDSVKAIIPFWRPGRYEGGNFAKNFIGMRAHASGRELETRKVKGNLMHIHAQKGDTVTVSYLLYAKDLTAGNTYSDDELLLINPVNACLYIEGLEDESCQLDLNVPDSWNVATAMEREGNSYHARDMQHFMDTPILAAPSIKQLTYEVDGVPYHIHLAGEFPGEEGDLANDFRAFTKRQIEVFGDIPVKEYHFLMILLPNRAYHGVEHENSTVIILGPSENLTDRNPYKELLGVSSHELYHTWNIKYIRPADWAPYDFTNSDYSRLGYVAEGVTTYMGDIMLWQSGVFSDEEYFNELAILLKRHKDNEGRFNLSLADSSIDTWVDGYGRGTPRRRVSIYVEGALLAFVCDVWLLEATQGEKSLSDAMELLYRRVDPANGYTEEDYWNVLKEMAACDWETLRHDVVDNTGRLEEYARQSMDKLGLDWEENASENEFEKRFGAKLQKVGEKILVWNVFSNSPAEKAGLWVDDEVMSINGAEPERFLSENSALPQKVDVRLKSGFRMKQLELIADGSDYGYSFSIEATDSAIFQSWKGKEESKNS